MKIHPVILSGGSGSRLWPLSREHYPKPLLPLTSEQTLLQETASRLDNLADYCALLCAAAFPAASVVSADHRQGRPQETAIEDGTDRQRPVDGGSVWHRVTAVA